MASEDLRAADALYRRTFGYQPAEFRLNPFVLAAVAKSGGSVIGVKTAAGELVGLAYGFHAVDKLGAYHYSQTAVVDPAHQGMGIGEALKLAQRDHAVQRTGVSRMRWSFTPFLARNAHFNLATLGAVAVEYHPDYYDAPRTERLVVEWSFKGDGYEEQRAGAAVAIEALSARLGRQAAAVDVVDEPTLADARWMVFDTELNDRGKAELSAALQVLFAEGSALCWAGRVDGSRSAYLAVPRLLPSPATDDLTTQSNRFTARLENRGSAAVLRDRALAKERELFASTVDALRQDPALLEAAGLIVGARRRYIAGDGKSRAYAALLTADLTAGMSNVYPVDNAAVTPLDVLADVRETDTLVCFSFGQYRRTTLQLAEGFVTAGGRLVVVTDGPASPLATLTDTVIMVSTDSESYANSQTGVALVCHLLSTLTVASAKGAKRRLVLRDRIAGQLELY